MGRDTRNARPGGGAGNDPAADAGDVLDLQPAVPAEPGAPQKGGASGSTTPTLGKSVTPPVRRVGRRRRAGPARDGLAANDDVPSIGGLIYALQQKPSRRPFTVAAISTAIWASLCIGYGWATLSDAISTAPSIFSILALPQTVTLGVALTLPITLFWFLAMLIWRAQELRLMSSAMTEVAVRLAEPDSLAEQSVASLGQTVRRQVMSMNDAINRALGRAGELEALVHNEVSALERSYYDNEVRIRGLIQELASERQSLTNNSDRVSATLHGIGAQVSREIAVASEGAAKALSEATSTLSMELQKAGSQITARIKNTSDETSNLLSENGNSLLSSLSDMNQRIGSEVPTLLEKLSGEQTRLTRIVEGAGRNLSALETALSTRTTELDNVLDGKIETFNRTVGDKARALDAAIGEKMDQFDHSLTDKAKSFYKALDNTSMQIDRSIVERTQQIDNAFRARLDTMDQVINRQAQEVSGVVAHGVEAMRQSETLREVSEGLLNQVGDLTQRFENQSKSIMRAAHSLESSNFKIDNVLENRHAELSSLLDQISDRAQAFDDVMKSYSQQIDSSLSRVETRAEAVGQRTERTSQAAIEEIARLRSISEKEAQRTIGDLRQRFSRASSEVSTELDSLSARVSRTTNDARLQAHQVTGDMERKRADLQRQLNALPAAAQMQSDAARRTLQEQLRALDALKVYTTEQTARQNVSPAPSSGISATRAGLPMPSNPVPPPAGSAAMPGMLPQPTAGASDAAPPRRAAAQPRAAAPAAATDDGERWTLGDLLSRASVNEGNQPISNISSTSMGGTVTLDLKTIARALDTRTATDIWRRLNGGERNILGREIYTIDGQETFDEIGRRYVSDMAFRNTVNRYLGDFEQLLREVDQNDPGGQVVRSHLVSEMGRVYLLLAHASGRLA